MIKSNSDFRYDLEIGELHEKMLSDILSGSRCEVKTDLMFHKTGNIFIETRSRGKPSGLKTTEADYFCFILLHKDNRYSIHIFDTLKLKEALKGLNEVGLLKKTVGGDDDTSVGYIVNFQKLLKEYGR